MGHVTVSRLIAFSAESALYLFINSVAHIWGSRPYTEKNTARDNGFLALFTYGEGYHNFHHIFASDYRNGIKWFHYDPTKWMIRSLAAIGLASKLKRTPVERIEKAKAETLMSKTQGRLAKLPLAQDKLTLLQQEYDLLLKSCKIIAHYKNKCWKLKKNNMAKQCEKSALMAQYHELEAAWETQKQAWLALNARLLKPLLVKIGWLWPNNQKRKVPVSYQYDAIIIGTGPGGEGTAMNLSKSNKK